VTPQSNPSVCRPTFPVITTGEVKRSKDACCGTRQLPIESNLVSSARAEHPDSPWPALCRLRSEQRSSRGHFQSTCVLISHAKDQRSRVARTPQSIAGSLITEVIGGGEANGELPRFLPNKYYKRKYLLHDSRLRNLRLASSYTRTSDTAIRPRFRIQ
jgi:hypothetical protein